MTQITMSRPHSLLPGDRVRVAGDTNRMRRIVAGIGHTETETSLRTVLYLRPSRGFAKHVRLIKARKRREHADT